MIIFNQIKNFKNIYVKIKNKSKNGVVLNHPRGGWATPKVSRGLQATP